MSSGSSSSKSWAQITAETGSELHFIEDSRSVVIDGVLQIPHSVIDLGIQRLESAIVAQFVGAPPPLKVVSAMLNRLWSLGEPIYVSQISEGFLLVELDSVESQKWVLARSWHVHHQPMILRRWHKDIAPLVFAPQEKLVWLTFSSVPPMLLTNEGISWLASQYGKPIHRFVREGFTVRVCVLRGNLENEKDELRIHMGKGDYRVVKVSFPVARSYALKKVVKEWHQVAQPLSDMNGAKVANDKAEPIAGEAESNEPITSSLAGGGHGSASKTPLGVEDVPSQVTPPKTSEGVEGVVSHSPVSGIVVHSNVFDELIVPDDEGEADQREKVPEKPTLGDFMPGNSAPKKSKGKWYDGVKIRQQYKK
ncbi:hypothetical protein LINPERHAP1_LOCUS24437 [Linum perenne]